MSRNRLVRHRDGRREIVRLLSIADLDNTTEAGPLAQEKSIVWLESIARLPFVRVVEVRCARSRRGPLLLSGPERVVGYSKLMADAPRDPRTLRFTRRLFYLHANDSTATSPPARALNPRTILPGVAGLPASTPRSTRTSTKSTQPAKPA